MRRLLISLSIALMLIVPASAASGWPMIFGDSAHTSCSNVTLTPPLKVAWSKDVGGMVFSSTIVSDGTAFVNNGDGGKIVALDVKTGNIIWEYSCDARIESTPAYNDGFIVFGAYNGFVYKLDAKTGSLIWKKDIKSGMMSSPLIYSGKIFIGSDGKDFFALDFNTGEISWSLPGNITQSSPAASDGVVFIGMEAGDMYALDAVSGNVVWHKDIGPDAVHSSPLVYGGAVYVTGRNGTLWAFEEKTGAIKWAKDIGYLSDSTPSVNIKDGMIFAGTYGGHVSAFNASTGERKWISGFHGPVYGALTVAGDVLYGSTQDGKLFALSGHNGSMLWSYDTGSMIIGSPVVIDGYMLAGTIDKKVYAFEQGVPIATPTPAPTATTPAPGFLVCMLIVFIIALIRKGDTR